MIFSLCITCVSTQLTALVGTPSAYLCLNTTLTGPALLSATDTLTVYTTRALNSSTSCTLTFSAPIGMSLSLEWSSFSICPQNFIQVTESSTGRVLIAAATGGTIPPPIASMIDGGLNILYYSSVIDPHLVELGDGAIATIRVITAGAAFAQPACEAAVSCGTCMSLVGCNWCPDDVIPSPTCTTNSTTNTTVCFNNTSAAEVVNATFLSTLRTNATPWYTSSIMSTPTSATTSPIVVTGTCHWTGFVAGVLNDGSVETFVSPAPTWLCPANVTFSDASECPEIQNKTAILLATNITDEEVMFRQVLVLGVEGASEEIYFYIALIVALFFLVFCFTLLLCIKSRFSHRTNHSVPTLVSNLTRLAVFFKLTEITSLLALEFWAIGYLAQLSGGPAPPVPIIFGAVSHLVTLQSASSIIFILLVPMILYAAHVLPLEGKQVLCAFTILALPLLALGGGVAGTYTISHWSLVAIYNYGAGTQTDTLAAILSAAPVGLLGAQTAPLLMNVCNVIKVGANVDSSGRALTAVLPQFMPLMFFICAGICIFTCVISLTALYSNVDAFDKLAGGGKHPYAAWKLRSIGASLMFAGAPLEVLTVYAGLCISLPDVTPTSVRKILKWLVIIGIPTTILIIGAVIVLIAELRIYRQETSKVAPMPPPSPPPQVKSIRGGGSGSKGEDGGGGATIAIDNIVKNDDKNDKKNDNNEHLRKKK